MKRYLQDCIGFKITTKPKIDDSFINQQKETNQLIPFINFKQLCALQTLHGMNKHFLQFDINYADQLCYQVHVIANIEFKRDNQNGHIMWYLCSLLHHLFLPDGEN